MSSDKAFSVSLKLIDNYRFEVDFGDMGQLVTDEPEPLGTAEGPNPVRLLAASVANCLAASLIFAIRKFKGDPGQVEATVTGDLNRVEGRWRVTQMAVTLQLGNATESLPHIERVLEQFEDFCVVTQSVRQGVNVSVTVFDASGQSIHQNG